MKLIDFRYHIDTVQVLSDPKTGKFTRRICYRNLRESLMHSNAFREKQSPLQQSERLRNFLLLVTLLVTCALHWGNQIGLGIKFSKEFLLLLLIPVAAALWHGIRCHRYADQALACALRILSERLDDIPEENWDAIMLLQNFPRSALKHSVSPFSCGCIHCGQFLPSSGIAKRKIRYFCPHCGASEEYIVCSNANYTLTSESIHLLHNLFEENSNA